MIRSYKPDDLAIVMDIADRAWQPIYAMFRETYGEELFRHICPDVTVAKGKQVAAQCGDPPEWIYVCEAEGKVVGFVTFWLDPKRNMGVIGNNAVDPDCGLKGVGQEMYLAVLEYFRNNQMEYVEVLTGLDDAHERARRAYERAGFTIYHDERKYYKKL